MWASLLLLLRWLRLRWALWRLPHLPRGAPLNWKLLFRAASSHPLAVRLPAHHGVLITSPDLALHLLKAGAVRDVSAYQPYRSFLGSSLVLLPQSSAVHSSPHSHLRAALLPLFTSAAMKAWHEPLLSCTRRLLDRLSKSAQRGEGGRAAPGTAAA